MGLGWMFFWLFCLFVAGAWGIAAISQAKARQRQELIDLVRGRKRSHNAGESVISIPAEAFPTPQAPAKPADGGIYARWAQKTGEKAAAKAKPEQQRSKRAGGRQPGPCTLSVSYVDADGVWTQRNIAPYKSGATNARFDAWCDTRKARRTFFFERIHSATDLRTGRLITRADVFRLIHPSRSVPSELE